MRNYLKILNFLSRTATNYGHFFHSFSSIMENLPKFSMMLKKEMIQKVLGGLGNLEMFTKKLTEEIK